MITAISLICFLTEIISSEENWSWTKLFIVLFASPLRSPLDPVLRINDLFFRISSENQTHKPSLQQDVNQHKGFGRYDLNVRGGSLDTAQAAAVAHLQGNSCVVPKLMPRLWGHKHDHKPLQAWLEMPLRSHCWLIW